jgi:CYTH domain-containing protein
MALEIERKFLVDHSKWGALNKPEGQLYCQGYISDLPGRTIRVRIAGDNGYLTIKGPTSNTIRQEFEYQIPVKDAAEILNLFTTSRVEKIRYRILVGMKTWEVDVFLGDNTGLIIAEIELTKPSESFILPGWAEREVTEDQRYYNSYLATHPFNSWETKSAV